jgi:phosphomannomutase
MSDIVFGTDGWRARIAEGYTFDNVRRCAQGFASYLKNKYRDPAELAQGVVIGGDRRFESEFFAAAAAQVLAANGIPVHFCGGGIPTPIISFGVTDCKALGAINITASHNPPEDNGFKVRDAHGGAIPPEGLKEIEAQIPESVVDVKHIDYDAATGNGLICAYSPMAAYDRRIRSLVDVDAIRDAGFKVLVDNMWGNGAGYVSHFIGGGATQVVEYHAERNPIFPEMLRPEPIPPNVDAGLLRARELGMDVVCIMDGDADRCGFGDENGHFVDQLRVYGLLAMYLLEVRGERGPIIKTLSTTSMLDKLGQRYGVPVYNTGVGFKYVAPAMMEHQGMIGGEESGGYAFRGHVPERDGILANLYLLDLMRRTGKKPTELLKMLFDMVGGPHYYARIDTRLTDHATTGTARAELDAVQPATVAGLRVTDKVTVDGYKFMLEDGGWLLIRFSGTEPLIRVYCETLHEDKVQAILREGMRLAGIDNN